jgi:hypothetical protein
MSEVSWLLLERYKLGEVTAEERAKVEAALQRDLVARRRWREIAEVRRPAQRAIAIAAGILLPAFSFLVWSALQSPDPRAKGDALTLTAVEQDGHYKLHVTCVPPREVDLRVWVEQDGAVSEPLGASVTVMCSNDADVPGAIGFDSASPAKVCVSAASEQSCVTLEVKQ